MTTTLNTCHFVTLRAALTYYRPYGYNKSDILAKLERDEIHNGKPSPDARINSEGRYYVEVK